MLSAGEVVAIDETTLRVALWRETSTAKNLLRGANVVIYVFESCGVRYIWGHPKTLSVGPGSPTECFEVPVSEVFEDEHPGMPVTSAVRFTVDETKRDTTLAEVAVSNQSLAEKSAVMWIETRENGISAIR